jgi:hypothetical protein
MLLDTNIVSAFIKRDAQKRTPKLFEFVTAHLPAVEALTRLRPTFPPPATHILRGPAFQPFERARTVRWLDRIEAE